MSGGSRLRDQLSWRKVGESIVILDLAGNEYFSVRGAGVVIWQALEQGKDDPAIIGELLDTFDVTEERVVAELAQFLASLADRGLLAG